MSRRGGVSKNDREAAQHWGDAYAAIPKSVFALIAWHLANACGEAADAKGAAEKRFVQEWDALVATGFEMSKLPRWVRGYLLAAATEPEDGANS